MCKSKDLEIASGALREKKVDGVFLLTVAVAFGRVKSNISWIEIPGEGSISACMKSGIWKSCLAVCLTRGGTSPHFFPREIRTLAEINYFYICHKSHCYMNCG
jgi:hypothetical protein